MKMLTKLNHCNTVNLLMVLVFILFTFVLSYSNLMQRYNNYLEALLTQPPSASNIASIAIDNRSIRALGRWPWSRAIHADLIDKLTPLKIPAIGMDILFLENDLNQPENDRLLADAIFRNGHVVLPLLIENNEKKLPDIIWPLHAYSTGASRLGYTLIDVNQEGMVRGIALETNINQLHIPSLALAMLQTAQAKTLQFLAEKDFHNIFIPFINPAQDYQQFSYVDILSNSKLRQQLQGKYVFIGITANGLTQQFSTYSFPNQRLFSGMQLNVNTLATLLNNRFNFALSPVFTILINSTLICFALLSFQRCPPKCEPLTLFLLVLAPLFISMALLKFTSLWYGPAELWITLSLYYPCWKLVHNQQIKHLLVAEKEKTHATLRAIGDAIVSTDTYGCIEFMNPIAEQMTGFTLNQVLGMNVKTVIPIEENTNNIFQQALVSGQQQKATQPHYLTNHNKTQYAIQLSVNPRHDVSGKITGMVATLGDVTKIIDMQHQMTHLAKHDMLTDLPNRILLKERIYNAIVTAQNTNRQLAVVFIDIDGFKKVNDSLGHAVGDKLLIIIAKRLIRCKRKQDTVARWGGDEFIILLDQRTQYRDIIAVAERIISSLGKLINIEGHEISISPSIGISLSPQNGQHADELIAKADAAMYHVKNTGKNNYCFYNQNLIEPAKQQLKLENEIQHALLEQQFEVFYHALINLHDASIQGVEALVRWRHTEKGILFPNTFLPVAEKLGLSIPIGKWVIQEVCQQLNTWHSAGFDALFASLNLSADQFISPDLISTLKQAQIDNAIKKGFLQVEVTENIIINDIKKSASILQKLHAAGIEVTLDDFGSGFLSLNFLKQFPLHSLKIYPEISKSALLNTDDLNIFRSIISLGQLLNMQIIAKGIESKQQLKLVKQSGCMLGQGYYLSAVLNAEQMTQCLEKQPDKNI